MELHDVLCDLCPLCSFPWNMKAAKETELNVVSTTRNLAT